MRSPLTVTLLGYLALVSCASASIFYSAISPCPLPCSVSGSNPANWTYYHTMRELDTCDSTILFDFNIYSSLVDFFTIRACTTALKHDQHRRDGGGRTHEPPSSWQKLSLNHTRSNKTETSSSACGTTSQHLVDVHLSQRGEEASAAAQENLVSAASAVMEYLKKIDDACGETIMMARSSKTIVGAYTGALVDKAGITDVFQRFSEQVAARATATQLAEACSSSAPTTMGIFGSADGDVATLAKTLARWASGTCLSTDAIFTRKKTPMTLLSAVDMHLSQPRSQSVAAKGECKYLKAQAGDGCWSLAQRCGISQDDLKKYNSDVSDFCNTLRADQYLCCSAGSLPDPSPQPNSDGSCAEYFVQSNDTCYSIAKAHETDVDRINSVNKNTWGWAGCTSLQVRQKICLSKGDPPMPAWIPNAVCGPQVPHTKRPTDGTKLADLNPCKLNSCCDIWGQCGITPEFCTDTKSETGAPGTAKVGTNGCISNCGTEIVSSHGGKIGLAIGYFEAFNIDRPCLHMKPSDMPFFYGSVHFAFATISQSFEVEIGKKYEELFQDFLQLNRSRVLSFGGWTFSTAPETFPIFRQGVTDAHRETFATNAVKFLKDNGLSGLDFDWEYPGAPDIPGIPPGDEGDGERYLSFLKAVRQKLPKGATLSIAAPASYWYLRGFPIKEIGEVVDYIVYMTYDLHGQWDYGNKFANPGCPYGNCLRSHVNMTETNYALAMITKAGVPSYKIAVGVAQYGRSFAMTDPSCRTEECTFLGPESPAWKGECTQTSGYLSNYEIRRVISDSKSAGNDSSFEQWSTDEGDFVQFYGNQWVSYMTYQTYIDRLAYYFSKGFLGSVTWAMDLDRDYTFGNNGSDGSASESNLETIDCDYTTNFDSLDSLHGSLSDYHPYCASVFAVDALANDLVAVATDYEDVNKDYDTLFGYYIKSVDKIVQPVIDKAMHSTAAPFFDCVVEAEGQNATYKCPLRPTDLVWETSYNLYWVLRDKKGFYDEMLQTYGIEDSWITFEDKNLSYTCKGNCSDPGLHAIHWYHVPAKAKTIKIYNPKDIFTNGSLSIPDLSSSIRTTHMDLVLQQWDGEVFAPAEVFAVAVAMAKQSLAYMKSVKKQGQAEKDEERKELIRNIVMAVLLVIPIVGEEAAAAAGMANLARYLALIGEGVNVGESVYDLVTNPAEAPMILFGMLLGAGSLPRRGESFEKMRNVRRGMTDEQLNKFGSVVQGDSKKAIDITRTCGK